MFINPQPQKFNVRFKPEELAIVISAINMHIHNPGTTKHMINTGKNMLSRLESDGIKEVYTLSRVKYIIFGLSLIKSKQHKELVDQMITSLTNGIKPTNIHSFKQEKKVVTIEDVCLSDDKDWDIGDKVVCVNTVGLSSAFREVELGKDYTINYIGHNVYNEKLIWLKEIGIAGALNANRFQYSPNQPK